MAEHNNNRPQPQSGAKYKHILIQRCRHFGSWPNNFFHQDELRKVYVGDDAGKPLYLTFGVITHDPPQRATEHETATQHPPKGLPLADRTHRPGFWIGNTIIVGPAEEPELYSFKFDNAAPGEIDFFVGLQCDHEVSPEILEEISAPYLAALIGASSIYFGDFVVPVSSPQLFKYTDAGEKQITSRYLIRCIERPRISEVDIKSLFQKFLDQLGVFEPEKRGCLIVASRRYLSSFGEEDPIDRYCDLWEACEFLVKNLCQTDGRKIKGNVDSRISYAVAQQTGLTKARLNAVLVKPLYNIRKDIVHNAEDNPENLATMTTYLEAIVVQIFRFVLGMPASPCAQLSTCLTEAI